MYQEQNKPVGVLNCWIGNRCNMNLPDSIRCQSHIYDSDLRDAEHMCNQCCPLPLTKSLCTCPEFPGACQAFLNTDAYQRLGLWGDGVGGMSDYMLGHMGGGEVMSDSMSGHRARGVWWSQIACLGVVVGGIRIPCWVIVGVVLRRSGWQLVSSEAGTVGGA